MRIGTSYGFSSVISLVHLEEVAVALLDDVCSPRRLMASAKSR
jgi:hypothetical protein